MRAAQSISHQIGTCGNKSSLPAASMNKSASTDGLERPVSLDLRHVDLDTCETFVDLSCGVLAHAPPVLIPAAETAHALQARQASRQLGTHPATPVKTKPRIERNRVLVTGGAGFVGSHLCTFLVERGDHVRSLDALQSAVDLPSKLLRGMPDAEVDPALAGSFLQDLGQTDVVTLVISLHSLEGSQLEATLIGLAISPASPLKLGLVCLHRQPFSGARHLAGRPPTAPRGALCPATGVPACTTQRCLTPGSNRSLQRGPELAL